MGSMLRQSRLTILLSINAAAIVVAGILIAGAIGLTNGWNFHVISARTDVIADAAPDANLGGATLESAATVANHISSDPVPSGELWNEDEITMYQTGDYDICVGGGLKNLGDMYWQTDNDNVIAGFYSTGRKWLGSDDSVCKYPIIKGTGTVNITAGTYDGERSDTIKVTVLYPPIEEWKRKVLDLVNKERVNNGLGVLSWGDFCAEAANIRAQEITTKYSHTRPSGSDWSTVCEAPASGGVSGENLAMGNAAVSPETVVAAWMNSPDHRANILNPEFTNLAVGFIFDPNLQYKTYWSQFFSTY